MQTTSHQRGPIERLRQELEKRIASVRRELLDEITSTNTNLSATQAAQFVTLALSPRLTRERVLTAGDNIDLTDAGANGNVTLAADVGFVNAAREASLAAAVAAADNENVNLVFLPPGTYNLTGSISVPSNMHILGMPGAIVRLPGGATYPAFDMDNVSRVRIEGVRVTVAAAAGVGGCGFRVRGGATDVQLVDCEADGTAGGFLIRGEEGAVASTCVRINLDRCRALNSTALWGFEASEAESVLFDRCIARSNWLDGFKIRRMTFDVVIRGCIATDNGQDPGNAGDGIDAFAGGDTFIISDTICDDNLGNGITVKTDDLTRDDSATYGYIRNIQITNVICCGNDPGYGLAIYPFRNNRNNYFDNPPDNDDTTMPMPTHATVLGGYFYDNRETGLWLDAHNIVCTAPEVRRNGEHGIEIGVRAINVTLRDPIVVANSQFSSGTYNGVYIRGRHIRMMGGHVLGVDPDVVFTDAELAAATPSHGFNIYVDSTFSEDVEVHYPICAYSNAAGPGIRTDMTSGHCVFHLTGDGTPIGNVYGGPGSTWLQRDATGNIGRRWEKIHGAPNAPSVGWCRRSFPRVHQTVIAGDFSLTATGPGWGGAGAGVTVDAGSTEASGRIVVTVGAAPPGGGVVRYTFPGGAYGVAPRVRVRRNLGSGTTTTQVWNQPPTTTTVDFVLSSGTVVAGQTYGIEYEIDPVQGD